MSAKTTVVTAALASLVLATPAAARPLAVPTAVRCVRACAGAQTVTPGGLVRVTGRGFHRGLRASFPLSAAGRRRTVAAKVLGTTRLSAPVPAGARSGASGCSTRRVAARARSGPCASPCPWRPAP